VDLRRPVELVDHGAKDRLLRVEVGVERPHRHPGARSDIDDASVEETVVDKHFSYGSYQRFLGA
jgi:hypothetical protein